MSADYEGRNPSFHVPENTPNDFYNAVFNSIADYAIIVTDKKGIIISWSKGAEHVLGYIENEILEQYIGILFTPEDREKGEPEKELLTALQHGRAGDERYHVRKDQSRFWASGLVFPLSDKSGEHIGFTKVMRNVTSIKNNSKVLIDTLEYSKSIIETGSDAFLVLDKHYNIEAANKCFFELFHLKENDIAGKSLQTVNDQYWNIPQLDLQLQYFSTKQKIRNFEINHCFKDAGFKSLIINARNLYFPNNKVRLILLSIKDNTRKRELEQFKQAYVGVISHELKNPLASIKALAQIASRGAKSNDLSSLACPLERIEEVTLRLEKIVAKLLDFNKLEAGHTLLKKEAFDLKEVLLDVLNDIKHIFPDYSFVVETEGNLAVQADKFRIAMVITNLLTNAVKYSPYHKEIKVIVKQESAVQQVLWCVEDKGVGIPEQEQEHIFMPFSRASNVENSKISGSGLGLYISAKILELHDSKIKFKSEQNKGSEFCFTLPSADAN